jgi:hypothetical protein
MGVLRFLLTATWAAWIWLELVAVAVPAVLERLRGGERPRGDASLVVLLACAGVAFVVAARIARLPVGALPGPPPALLAGGLAVMWAGLVLRAWSIRRLGGLIHAVVVPQGDRGMVAGALAAAAGFGVALGHWTSLLALVAGWTAGLAWSRRAERARS